MNYFLKITPFFFSCIILLFSQCKSSEAEDKLVINPDDDLQTSLNKIISNEQIPGLVAAIIDSNGIRTIEAAGVRKFESPDLITTEDRLHLGSCTKAMTSALIATLVQDDLMRWEMTVAETFPMLSDSIHPAYHEMTVRQLCMHRSGVEANVENLKAFSDLDMIQTRQKIMIASLKDKPKNKNGDFLYSNLGYIIAGHMAEKVTGKSWETLMQERLFDPLKMSSAGFGPPGETKKINEPWGHRKLFITKWIPYQLDNEAALGPAGTVHCNMADWSRFVSSLLLKKTSIFQQEQVNILVEPDGDYACGWAVTEEEWSQGKIYTHNGSNTMWLSVVKAAPGINRAYLVVANSMGDESESACKQVIEKLESLDQN